MRYSNPASPLDDWNTLSSGRTNLRNATLGSLPHEWTMTLHMPSLNSTKRTPLCHDLQKSRSAGSVLNPMTITSKQPSDITIKATDASITHPITTPNHKFHR